MPTELEEQATSFLDANRVFSLAELAEAVGLPQDPKTARPSQKVC